MAPFSIPTVEALSRASDSELYELSKRIDEILASRTIVQYEKANTSENSAGTAAPQPANPESAGMRKRAAALRTASADAPVDTPAEPSVYETSAQIQYKAWDDYYGASKVSNSPEAAGASASEPEQEEVVLSPHFRGSPHYWHPSQPPPPPPPPHHLHHHFYGHPPPPPPPPHFWHSPPPPPPPPHLAHYYGYGPWHHHGRSRRFHHRYWMEYRMSVEMEHQQQEHQQRRQQMALENGEAGKLAYVESAAPSETPLREEEVERYYSQYKQSNFMSRTGAAGDGSASKSEESVEDEERRWKKPKHNSSKVEVLGTGIKKVVDDDAQTQISQLSEAELIQEPKPLSTLDMDSEYEI